MLRTRLVAVAATAATLASVPAVAPAAPVAPAPRAVAAKRCSAGFTHARINGVQKCLRAGEFCAHAYNRRAPRPYSYRHYGYRCTKRDSRGNYHLTRA